MTVLAASSGLSVDAMTDIVERINKIMSRFHNGQFYVQSVHGYRRD